MNKQKGQAQILFGIVVVLIIVGAVMGFNLLGKSDETEPSESGDGEQAVEEMAGAPVRSDLFPSGTLPAGTTETKISVNTNEPGYCRYSTKSGQSYDSMSSRFSYDENKTFHSAQIKGLKNGQTYEYSVRCRDLQGNKNESDAKIVFTVAGTGPSYYPPSVPSSGADETPPMRYDLYPTGTLPAGTTETQISVRTNEPGYCRYSIESGKTYDSMSSRFSYNKDKVLHTATVKGLQDNKIHEYYVRCRDLKGNKNENDAKIRFGVGGAYIPSSPGIPSQDNNPPYCFAGFPTEDLPYYTKKTTISLKTDEKAICRYGLVSGLSHDSMNRIFSNTDSTFHSTEVTGLSEDTEYTYYIKCADDYGNKNTDDFLISFQVEAPEDVTPPVRTILYPDRDLYYGTTETQLGIKTDEPAYCRYATEQGVSYSSMKKRFSREEGDIHTATVTGLENGVYYTFFVRCKDMEGNVNTGDVMIRFRVTP